MQATVSFILIIGLVVKVQTSTQRIRTTRQAATRSCEASTEACLLLSSCPQLQRLLNPPTEAGISRLQADRCGTHNNRAQVCCPTGDQPTSTPSVPTQPVPALRVPSTPASPAPTTASSNEALLPRSCGHPLLEDKIHGGTPAELGAFPWMAVLGFQSDSAGAVEWGCGGSLINDRYVLTAAHCTNLTSSNQKLSVVRLGENNLETEEDCKGDDSNRVCSPSVEDFKPEEVVLHPDYAKRGYESDDIALIRLDRPVVFSAFIHPLCLPGPGDAFDDIVGEKKAVVIGFGDTEFGRRSLQLLQVLLPVVAKEQCRSVANYATTLVTGGGQVCLGGQFQQDSCFKDSGGPAMVTKNPNGPPYVQVGIVSYGNFFCGLKAVPAIYTDVTHYRGWIVDNLKP